MDAKGVDEDTDDEDDEDDDEDDSEEYDTDEEDDTGAVPVMASAVACRKSTVRRALLCMYTPDQTIIVTISSSQALGSGVLHELLASSCTHMAI